LWAAAGLPASRSARKHSSIAEAAPCSNLGGSLIIERRLERAAFGLRRLKGNGSDDNLLQKIRNKIKFGP
jgi:hypothetical protein